MSGKRYTVAEVSKGLPVLRVTVSDRIDIEAAQGDFPYPDGASICCPQCDNLGSDGVRYPHLHHRTVTVFDRIEEDHDVIVTRISRGKVVRELNGSGNPSRRRGGIAIEFWCELCHGVSVLTLAQHKGSTHLEWQFNPDYKNDGTTFI
jgi:hypothetical protein